MKIKILGSGGWEGIPAPFCNCRVCKIARKNPNSKDYRTRPEILVETEKGSFLIEISPDIRLQAAKHKLSQIRDFLVSHWHFDHMYGLLELDSWSKHVMGGNINIHCSKSTKAWLDVNFAHVAKKIKVLRPFEQFNLYGVKVTAIPVYHMYDQDNKVPESKLENSFGYVLEKGGKKVSYLVNYYKLPAKSIELVKGSDLIIVDGTYLFQEQFVKVYVHKDLKADKDHLHGQQILDFAKSLNAKKIVISDITHLSCKTHDELQKMLPKGMSISYDGLEFKF